MKGVQQNAVRHAPRTRESISSNSDQENKMPQSQNVAQPRKHMSQPRGAAARRAA